MSGFIKWLKKHVCEDDAWITVHPNASGPGSPVLLDDEGYIKGGMGGKFNGQRIDLMPRKSGYGVPVSENDPLNNSTPGFLRTFRYNLKAPTQVPNTPPTTPQNIAPQATTEQQTPNTIETQNTNINSETPAIMTPPFANLTGATRKMHLLEEHLETTYFVFGAVSKEQRAEVKNNAIRKYNDFVKTVENNLSAIKDPSRALDICAETIWQEANAELYRAASEKYKGYAKYAREAENKATITGGIMDGLIQHMNGTLTTEPKSLAGVTRGAPMNQKEADEGNANPNYLVSKGHMTNCQTCVVAYEARLRGYDVIAGAERSGNVLSEIAKHTQNAWIDPATGFPPEPKKAPHYVRNSKDMYSYLSSELKQGERYNLSMNWLGGKDGHIVTLEKTMSGDLKIYDPQSGQSFTGENEVNSEYLGKISYSGGIGRYDLRPEFYRVDNLAFNERACGKMLKKQGKKKPDRYKLL